MQHLLIDDNHFPSPSLIFLMDLMGLTHDYSLKTLVRITQECWLQADKERWQFDPREEHRLDYMFPFLRNLGCLDAMYAQENAYDYAIVFGSYYTRMQLRLAHLMAEWERGVRFRKLVFLSGERYLDPLAEAPQFQMTGQNTESELMLHLWEKCGAEHPLKRLPLTHVDAPARKLPSGKRTRPTTMDTLLKWLSYLPKPGKCLFITSQPFIGYQHAVIKTRLPADFTFETVGSDTEKHLALSVYLDNLARWLYQEKVKIEQK